MHTDEKKPAGDWHPEVGHTDNGSIPALQSNVAKELATVQAQFALRGHELHRAADGFYVTRWGLTRTLPTLADVRAFLAQIGGAA